MSEKRIDCMGLTCPLPIIKAKDALSDMHAGDILNVYVDNEISVQNLEKFARVRGHDFSWTKEDSTGRYDVKIVCQGVPDDTTILEEEKFIEEVAARPDSGILVVINQDAFGHGDEKLSEILIKSFFFTLTKSDVLPKTILFYNSGVKLVCEGSPVLEDLHALSCAGCEIYACGTCLDYYGLKDKVRAAAVTNMYDIVEMMMHAAKIVKP